MFDDAIHLFGPEVDALTVLHSHGNQNRALPIDESDVINRRAPPTSDIRDIGKPNDGLCFTDPKWDRGDALQ